MPGPQPIKLAILAMGGEGGGVLADWIVDLGEHSGYIAQTTSVPGVAQRTGATIYYLELFPQAQSEKDGGQPVLALMPLPGDVDVVLASELMEAGRAVQRGLVTPERTTLVTSTHRVYAIAEKTAMGDGRVDSAELLAHTQKAAKRCVRFDMAQIAEASGSVVSAVLFGALAGTGVLPFSRAQFESTIERGGVGVKSSLKAFAAGFAQASNDAAEAAKPGVAAATPSNSAPREPAVAALLQRVRNEIPADAQALATEGVRRLIDYQDPAYANLYLDRLSTLKALPGSEDERNALVKDGARHLALWMSYEDTIRVADLKTRASRHARVQSEAQAAPDQLLSVHEFMHPRIEEICETLPAGLGLWLSKPHWVHRLVASFMREGRIVTTSSLRGFLLLWCLASLRGTRRGSLRFQVENARIEQWLALTAQSAATNPALALEVLRCQGLVKGYSDTHARGLQNFQALMAVVRRAGASLAPATLRELREAALADEQGRKLHALLVQHAFV